MSHHPLSTQHSSTFYYDYSEDFNTAGGEIVSLDDGISRISVEAANMRLAMMREEECKINGDNRLHSEKSTLIACLELPSAHQPSRRGDSRGHISQGPPTPSQDFHVSEQLDGAGFKEPSETQVSQDRDDLVAPGEVTLRQKLSPLSPFLPTESKSGDLAMLVGLSEDMEKTILSPTPISPARNLRVRNSITHMDTHMGRVEKLLPSTPESRRDAVHEGHGSKRSWEEGQDPKPLAEVGKSRQVGFGRSEKPDHQ